MRLCLMRHGQAERKGALYVQDQTRPLTPEGAAEMERVGYHLDRLGLGFDLILTSPFVRARQTADIIARCTNYHKEPELEEVLGTAIAPYMLARHLEELPQDQTVLLVGHAPVLPNLAAYLFSNDDAARLEMKTGSMVWLEVSSFATRNALLHWLCPAAVWPD